MARRSISEAETRKQLLDPALEKVGWYLRDKTKVGIEIPVDDMQLLELERTLQRELGGGDLELSPENIRKAYGLKVDNFLGFVRQVLELDALPDYTALVARQFAAYITQHNFNADQIRFLTAVQSVFLQKRRLEVADLYEPSLNSFGADAVDQWFSEKEVEEVVEFAKRMAV